MPALSGRRRGLQFRDVTIDPRLRWGGWCEGRCNSYTLIPRKIFNRARVRYPRGGI